MPPFPPRTLGPHDWQFLHSWLHGYGTGGSAAGGPDWATVLTAVGTVVLASVGVIGALAANSRLRRGTPSLAAAAHARSGGVTVHVLVEV